ncbi:PKD domain-containing protein [Culturomica massiliensis]|uniref:PKD domain-containing protein n=1 Tax=Culturomica massiliensis TaxID=1841857 RepID=UPI003AB33D89
MWKFNNTMALILLAIIGGSVLIIILLFNSFGPSFDVKAGLSKNTLLVGEEFRYTDSTRQASSWLWEFGDGETSAKPRGSYKYDKAGSYKIRLRVNGGAEKIFSVTVRNDNGRQGSRLIRINAPESAMQGELIVFRGVGGDKQWRWEFGESGMVDAREKDVIYKYNRPGVYEVKLYTENTRYPVSHLIKIVPQYSASDSTDVASLIGADIREKLQNIAGRKPFNTNYNYIVNKYLGGNQRTEVVINNTKYNDIYSYCQGLRMSAKNSVVIDRVIVEIADLETGIVTKIMVLQTDKQ